KLAVHGRLRSLLVNLPSDSMLLSICEQLDPWDVVDRMAAGVDVEHQPAWAAVCDASGNWLGQLTLRRRLFYVAAALPSTKRPWMEVVRDGVGDVSAVFGVPPRSISPKEIDQRRRQARELEIRLAQHITLRPATAGEVCWLYAR